MGQFVLTVAVRIEVWADDMETAKAIGREKATEIAPMVADAGAYETEFVGMIEIKPEETA